jgi:hypothetical protein
MNEQPVPAITPEHLELAVNMANNLIDRFSMSQQNEAIKIIERRIVEYRQAELAQHQEACKAITASLDVLNQHQAIL